MLTPRFSCSQTTDSVIVSIYCPSIRASDVEITVDRTLVIVHVNPYFLRLNFSYTLVEDDDSSASYDPSIGYLTLTLSKEEKGRVFEDLDLLAKLLAAPQEQSSRYKKQGHSIEVLNSSPTSDGVDELTRQTESLGLNEDDKELLTASENDWVYPQALQTESRISIPSTVGYGFLNLHTGFFRNISYTENEVNELGNDAETVSREERRRRRMKREDDKFDAEHYLADYADDEQIQDLISWKHPFCDVSPLPAMTEQQELSVLHLPKKEYIPTALQTRGLYLTLVQLLFAYAYDSRTTQKDPTTESAWTICSLTPSFSALDPPPYKKSDRCSLDDNEFTENEVLSAILPSYRRALAFPLYRSWLLCEACRKDVASFLTGGIGSSSPKRMVFRCLLELKDVLDHHDVYYVYSKIWADDFCVWIQSCTSDKTLASLGKTLARLNVPKAAIGWELEKLEDIADDTLLDTRQVDSDDE